MVDESSLKGAEFIEFTAKTRMSGVDLPDGTKVRKGASDAIEQYVKENGGKVPADLRTHVEEVSSLGRHASGGVREQQGPGRHLPEGYGEARHGGAVRALRPVGIKDHHVHRRQPLTAATIAKEAGVDGLWQSASLRTRSP